MHAIADHVIESDAASIDALIGSPATLFSDGNPASNFEIVKLPSLNLPDGEIIATDGIILEGFPYTRRLAPGSHDVRLAIATSQSGDARIAFAIVGSLSARVARFELALTVGQELGALKPGNVYGYPVDAGIGCLASPAAHALLGREPDLLATVSPAMQSVHRKSRDWCTVVTDAGSAALFTSGYGDGLYASFFGLDAAGEPVVLITDFSIVEWPRNPVLAPAETTAVAADD